MINVIIMSILVLGAFLIALKQISSITKSHHS